MNPAFDLGSRAGDLGRANALEGNVVLYKTVGGKRSSLDYLLKELEPFVER